MSRTLDLSPGLKLPMSFATEGVAAIGMRGSGKSNTLVRWAEVLYDAGIPFVAVDPKGDWYGIKSSMDGKSPGLSVPVFGGLHEDLPLTYMIGARIADLLVDQNISAVLDVSRMSIENRATFLTMFCNRLMDRHQLEPHVRCVILEEAHRYIPQNVTGKTAAVKEAAASLLLEGRAFGLGCWAATQRPARLHKDVLEEVGTAFLHRVGAAATNDLKTIRGWLAHEDIGGEVAASLTRLDPGEAWVLSPSDFDVVQRVRVDRRRTFDTGATPLVGAGSRPTLTFAEIDQAALKESLADEIEKAKADDPKELRKKIRELESALAERPTETVEVETIREIVPDRVRQVAASVAANLALVAEKMNAAVVEWGEALGSLDAEPVPCAQVVPLASIGRVARPTPRPASGQADPSIDKRGRKILTVLAQYPNGKTQHQIAILAGYSPAASTTGAGMTALRQAGFITYGQPAKITPEGLAALGDHEDLPTGDALIAYWLGKLGKRETAFLNVLLTDHPDRLTERQMAERTGYSPDSSTVGAGMSRLRALGLVEGWNLHPEFAQAIGR